MKAKRIVVAILVLLIIGLVGFYIYDVTVNGTPYKENLFKFIALVVAFLVSIFRVCRGSETRKPLSFYEKIYSEHIQGVYSRDQKSRKTLLKALRYYDESNYKKALSLLNGLKEKRPSRRDMNAVCLVSALCCADWGLYDEAVKEYEAILATDPDNVTVLGNLGLLCSKAGDYESAEKYLTRALEIKPDDVFACNNLAYMYFRARELLRAIEYSLKTLEIQPNFRQAASLLAIIYYAADNAEKFEKYRQLAIKCGESAKTIDELAADNYETLRAVFDEYEEYPE